MSFFVKFYQISVKLLSNFCQIFVRFLSIFYQISVKFVANFSPISVNFQSNFCQISVKFLPNYCQNFCHFLSIFRHFFVKFLSDILTSFFAKVAIGNACFFSRTILPVYFHTKSNFLFFLFYVTFCHFFTFEKIMISCLSEEKKKNLKEKKDEKM